MPRTSIIIPAFNQAALTAQCLRAVLERSKCEIIVVDDASSDATAEMLAGFDKQIKVITHRTNKGFARSCNDGASVAFGDYLVFLNSDTIPQRGWLAALERFADKNPRAAVIGSKLLYPNNTVQHAGVVICQDRYPRHIYAGFPANHSAVNKSRRFQIVTGACMLVRRKIFTKAGGFDTKFHNGFEDVDFCLRLGEAGHEIHFCAESVVQHFESVSPQRFKNDRQNVTLYRKRWIKRVQPDDLRYYVEDDLFRVNYEGRYPFGLEISPLLATVDNAKRNAQTEKLLQNHSRQIAGLQRDNTLLRLELGSRGQDSPGLRYQELRERVRQIVQKIVPTSATVLVVSKGDGALLDFSGRRGWHFPQTSRGSYAGHHPANSTEAVSHLEKLRKMGAEYFVIPSPSLWWLDYYSGFGKHLDAHYVRLEKPNGACVIYDLKHSPKSRR